MKTLAMALSTLLLSLVSVPGNAALFDRGGGMIYDDVLNITWLQNASTGGALNWFDSMAFADNLVYGGFDDWRLPNLDVNLDGTIVNCNGASELDCRDNELGYMYYFNFGCNAGEDWTGNPTSVDGIMFSNVLFDHWSNTEQDPANAWLFTFFNGTQFPFDKGAGSGAWAVRDGDVAVIPLPAGVWLLASGLFGLAALRRR